ncbi:MAG: leucine-, isoleucine-, valine-, threonine-, and alanine-binding protein, partial [Candidatus Margulisbacteria bacterium GWF2_35_9]
SALGTGVLLGAKTLIDKVNALGGVNGRSIKLISLDDGYEPDQTIANTNQLIDKDKVFAMLGFVGTPTSKAVLPMIVKNNVPFLGPFTGAEVLRSPFVRQVFNVRASYFDETEALVDYLINKLNIKEIGIFIQDDGYGDSGRSGVVKALRERGLKLAGEGRYTRNTVAIDTGLAELMKTKPGAIIMVGAYKPCAAFIKKAVDSGMKSVFCNISFVGTTALVTELGKYAEGTYISQVVPIPDDTNSSIVQAYQKDMIAAGSNEFEFTSLEGYIDAMVLVEGLKKVGANLTRDSFMNALEGLKMKAGDLEVSYSSKSHQGLKDVYLTTVKNGKVVLVN